MVLNLFYFPQLTDMFEGGGKTTNQFILVNVG